MQLVTLSGCEPNEQTKTAGTFRKQMASKILKDHWPGDPNFQELSGKQRDKHIGILWETSSRHS